MHCQKCIARENTGYAYEKRAPALHWYGAPISWLIRLCFVLPWTHRWNIINKSRMGLLFYVHPVYSVTDTYRHSRKSNRAHAGRPIRRYSVAGACGQRQRVLQLITILLESSRARVRRPRAIRRQLQAIRHVVSVARLRPGHLQTSPPARHSACHNACMSVTTMIC